MAKTARSKAARSRFENIKASVIAAVMLGPDYEFWWAAAEATYNWLYAYDRKHSFGSKHSNLRQEFSFRCAALYSQSGDYNPLQQQEIMKRRLDRILKITQGG